MNKKLKPIIRYEGGRKFFFPEKQRQVLKRRFNSYVTQSVFKLIFVRGFRLPDKDSGAVRAPGCPRNSSTGRGASAGPSRAQPAALRQLRLLAQTAPSGFAGDERDRAQHRHTSPLLLHIAPSCLTSDHEAASSEVFACGCSFGNLKNPNNRDIPQRAAAIGGQRHVTTH